MKIIILLFFISLSHYSFSRYAHHTIGRHCLYLLTDKHCIKNASELGAISLCHIVERNAEFRLESEIDKYGTLKEQERYENFTSELSKIDKKQTKQGDLCKDNLTCQQRADRNHIQDIVNLCWPLIKTDSYYRKFFKMLAESL